MTASGEPPRFAHRMGTVVEFDDHAGHGTIETGDGTRVFFHCTRIADGSRTIPVGENVGVDVRPMGLGDWEAGRVFPISS